MKLNFNFDGKTFLSKWWKIVRDNFTAIQTDHNTLSDKLDTEITQRTNADVGLADKITAETKARESTDNTLQGNIDAEAKNRRVGDSELREQILTEQTNRTNADDILNGEKADKTDLYGKETDVVHTITHSLEKSDLSIDINTSYGDGTITINSLAVQTKIFLDGNSAIQTEPISASFSAEKGEEGEKWVNLLYDQYTGKLGLEVTEQPEAGNVAKIAVTYMKAEVAEMYAGQLKFDGIKDLRALKTDNKNSFLAAVNEISTKLTTEISDREDADDELKAKFTDLKTVAFTGSYTDLSNKPTSMQNPNSLTLTMNGSSSIYNGSATASKSWYAPTSAGTAGYNLISNGSGAPVWQQPPYAVCNTATTTAAKTVSITNFKLITGARVLVKFTYAHKSSGSATLNISNTGAKTICIEKPEAPYGNSSFSITSITSQNSWQAGDILDLVYNGTNWCVIGSTGFLQSGRYSSNVIIGTEENNLGAYCDYICDGSNDQTIIQQAINDLPSTGGKIVLLEGTYNISEELTLPYPITFEGTVNTSLYVLSQGLLRYDTNNISASNIATFKDININFCSTDNDTEGYVGAFENFELTFENCIITKRTSYQSVQRLFLNCKVKMINTDVDITMPNSGFGAPYDCFWVFGESTVELLNTHIWFTGENPVNNGVFYDSKGTMTGGWITNTKKDTSNHGKSYILHSSPITFLGTQIRCREFAQEWNSNTSNGFSPSLDSCKIEILDGGDFSCSHASHIDLVLSSSSKTSVISAYALISNSKLFITFDHQLELRDYAFLEACYVNRVNYKASGSASSAKTTDTSTVTSMAKPIFIDTEGNK